MLARVLVCSTVLLCACASTPDKPPDSAQIIITHSRGALDLVLRGNKIVIGNRELTDDGEHIYGFAGDKLWRLEKRGDTWSGKLDGMPATLTIARSDDETTIFGHVRGARREDRGDPKTGHHALLRPGVEAAS